MRNLQFQTVMVHLSSWLTCLVCECDVALLWFGKSIHVFTKLANFGSTEDQYAYFTDTEIFVETDPH